MMLDKFKNIKAGVFIELLTKSYWRGKSTITIDEIGAYLLSIPQSLEKDFADDYWITLRYINREMVKATIITLKERQHKADPSPYLYKEYNIKLKKPLTKEEFKYFLYAKESNFKKDRIYEIERPIYSGKAVGGYLDYDSEWLDNVYCWTTFDEIFPMEIISSQRPMLNWDKEPWGDLK